MHLSASGMSSLAFPLAKETSHGDKTPRRPGLHLRYGSARHAGLRHHRAGAAAAHLRLPARRHGARLEIHGLVCHYLGAHAVLLFSDSRHAFRPLRKAASHPAVELRPRPGLHRDGALATLGWLFLGRVLSGITSSSIPTPNSYISDVTP